MVKVVVNNAKGLVQYAGKSEMTVENQLVAEGLSGLRDAKTFRDPATSGAARTAVSNGLALSVNTQYESSLATAQAATIPSAAAGRIGDWITVLYTADINDSTLHTYTTTTDANFALGSVILRADGAIASEIDISVADDNILTIDADTNGDGGIGTTLKFVNMTGAANGWAVDCLVRGQGAKSVAKNGATAFS
jgi:hypothetical protein